MDRVQSLASFGFSAYAAKNSNIQVHRHRYFELAYVESGEMEHWLNDKMTVLKPGDYFIVDHGVSHSYNRVSEDRLVVRNYMFYPHFLDRSLQDNSLFWDMMRSYLMRYCCQTLRSDPTGQTFTDDDGCVLALLDTIQREYEAESYGYLEYIRCALVEVLILTARKIGQQPSPGAKSEIIRELKRYADLNYTKPIRLQNAAEALGYCVPYLSKKFSAEMGMGFTDYLHRLRLQHGCRLLENTDLTVAQVAEKVGYEGAKYFTQMLKKHLHTTPGKFRAEYKKQ